MRALTRLSNVVSCFSRLGKHGEFCVAVVLAHLGVFEDPAEIKAGFVTLLAQLQPEPLARCFHKTDQPS